MHPFMKQTARITNYIAFGAAALIVTAALVANWMGV